MKIRDLIEWNHSGGSTGGTAKKMKRKATIMLNVEFTFAFQTDCRIGVSHGDPYIIPDCPSLIPTLSFS